MSDLFLSIESLNRMKGHVGWRLKFTLLDFVLEQASFPAVGIPSPQACGLLACQVFEQHH